MKKEQILELERHFRALKNVRSAHIDIGENGEVIAIGVFSDGARHPKDIKRDVEETFRQIAGYRINHTKISIVEQNFDMPLIAEERRIRFLTAYQVQGKNGVIEGFVQLEYNDDVITGSTEAHHFQMELEYIIANASAVALMKIIEDYSLRIDNVKEVSMGSVDIIVVTLTAINQLTGTAHMLVGSVIKTKDLLSSVAKATLDALNRRIDQMV